jgi:hypothetical protein
MQLLISMRNQMRNQQLATLKTQKISAKSTNTSVLNEVCDSYNAKCRQKKRSPIEGEEIKYVDQQPARVGGFTFFVRV